MLVYHGVKKWKRSGRSFISLSCPDDIAMPCHGLVSLLVQDDIVIPCHVSFLVQLYKLILQSQADDIAGYAFFRSSISEFVAFSL